MVERAERAEVEPGVPEVERAASKDLAALQAYAEKHRYQETRQQADARLEKHSREHPFTGEGYSYQAYRGMKGVPYKLSEDLLPAGDNPPAVPVRPRVYRCSICGTDIINGASAGTGDGSMKDGGSFAHLDCYRDRYPKAPALDYMAEIKRVHDASVARRKPATPAPPATFSESWESYKSALYAIKGTLSVAHSLIFNEVMRTPRGGPAWKNLSGLMERLGAISEALSSEIASAAEGEGAVE